MASQHRISSMQCQNHQLLCAFSEVAGCKFIGCPKCIEDNKYERNAFMFNFVFVFDSSTDTSPYEAVILKMGNAFKSYEVHQICSTLSDLLWSFLLCLDGELIPFIGR